MDKLSYLFAYTNPAEALRIYEERVGEFTPDIMEKQAAVDWSSIGDKLKDIWANPAYQRLLTGAGGALLGAGLGRLMLGRRGTLLGAGLGGLGAWWFYPELAKQFPTFFNPSRKVYDTAPTAQDIKAFSKGQRRSPQYQQARVAAPISTLEEQRARDALIARGTPEYLAGQEKARLGLEEQSRRMAEEAAQRAQQSLYPQSGVESYPMVQGIFPNRI